MKESRLETLHNLYNSKVMDYYIQRAIRRTALFYIFKLFTEKLGDLQGVTERGL